MEDRAKDWWDSVERRYPEIGTVASTPGISGPSQAGRGG